MSDRATRDTVPAMPVPGRNLTAEMRAELEAKVRQRDVAIVQLAGDLWRGLTIDDEGVATGYTIDLSEKEARAWLKRARESAKGGYWIPTVCPRCGFCRLTPDICTECRKMKK